MPYISSLLPPAPQSLFPHFSTPLLLNHLKHLAPTVSIPCVISVVTLLLSLQTITLFIPYYPFINTILLRPPHLTNTAMPVVIMPRFNHTVHTTAQDAITARNDEKTGIIVTVVIISVAILTWFGINLFTR